MKAKPKDWSGSRAEQAPHSPMPPIPDCGDYLRELFVMIGPASSGYSGMLPVPFQEIAAAAPWATGRERKVVHDMSKAFIDGSNTGSDAFGLPPWQPD